MKASGARTQIFMATLEAITPKYARYGEAVQIVGLNGTDAERNGQLMIRW